MANPERDEVTILSKRNPQSKDESLGSGCSAFLSRTQSASISIPMDSVASFRSETSLMSHTGPLRSERKTPFAQMSGPLFISRKPEIPLRQNQVLPTGQESSRFMTERLTSFGEKDQYSWQDEDYNGKNAHLLRSGPLGMCNDPYCTTCPTYYKFRSSEEKFPKTSGSLYSKFHNVDDAKGWARRFVSFLHQYAPGVMNPHTKVVQRWNKFFVISSLVAIFVDPLFFFLISVSKEYKCIMIDLPVTRTIVIFRSITDLIYLLNMLLQFRLAYIAPESRVVGAGELVDHPKKIALNYIQGYFFIDLFVVLPLPQIIISQVRPKHLGSSGANNAKNLLRAAVLAQYIPRLARFLPLFAGQSPTGFIFESAWANFVINLLTFMLAGHVVGSSWYLFGLQRVNQCFRDACRHFGSKSCAEFIDCGYGKKNGKFSGDQLSKTWTDNVNATACFSDNNFPYGIYAKAVNLTTEQSIVTRYVYSLFWGFQQISTSAGNQVPSYFVWEVLFTMAIIGLGLLLFAFLVGNMQNFLLALGRRRLEMQLRRRDVEQWMSHRRLPIELRRRVREAERYNWAATRGVNEETLLENLPEDLQRDIRRHLFKCLKKVRIFSLMDEPILDAICERLRQKTYIKGSNILYDGGPIEKMVFIVRGKLESKGEDGLAVTLSEGDVCGEQLITWCLEHSTLSKDRSKFRIPGQRVSSNRTVKCLTNVEAFALRAADIEEVTIRFPRFLRNPRVQGALRYESPYWRSFAATSIQVAWKYRKKHSTHAKTSKATYSSK